MMNRRDPYISNYSKAKAMMTDLKILQFQEALERQQRSVKKLKAKQAEVPPSINFQRRRKEPIHAQNADLQIVTVSVACRGPKPYVPLNKQQQVVLSGEQKKQWQYLQSLEYQRYLEQILCATGNQKDLVQKIKLLRSNSIYLSKARSIEEDQQEEYQNRPHLYNKHTPQLNQMLSCSKITEMETYFPQSINCRPYLQNNSMFDPLQDGHDELVEKRDMVHNIRIQEQEEQDYVLPTPHLHKVTDQNIKTVIRAKPITPNNVLMASTKTNLDVDRQKEKKEFIDRQLNRFDKQNRKIARKQHTPSESPQMQTRNKKTIPRGIQGVQKQKKTIVIGSDSASLEFRRDFYKKDRIDVSSASLYNIDFKLSRPNVNDRSFSRCASANTLSAEKSPSLRRSSSKIKMSVVTVSGRGR